MSPAPVTRSTATHVSEGHALLQPVELLPLRLENQARACNRVAERLLPPAGWRDDAGNADRLRRWRDARDVGERVSPLLLRRSKSGRLWQLVHLAAPLLQE